MEENQAKGKSRNVFQAIKQITGKFTPRMATVKDQDGKVLTEGKEIQERWKQYTQRLYSRDEKISNDFTEEEFTEEPEPTLAEIEHAIRELACNKAPGIDNIPIELVKNAGKETLNIISKLCQLIWKTTEWPVDWKRSVFLSLPKKGDVRECSNNRTISLIVHMSKILLKIIQKRLTPYTDREISIEQAGFIKGRGTRHQIAKIRWILEKVRGVKKEI